MKRMIGLIVLCSMLMPLWSGEKDGSLQRVLEANAQYRGKAVLDNLEVVWSQIDERAFLVRKKPHFVLILILDDKGGIAYAEGFDGKVSWGTDRQR